MVKRTRKAISKEAWLLFSKALNVLRTHEPLQIAGAASFFAVFALPAILIILSALFSLFGNALTVREDLLTELSLSVDKETITQVSKTVGRVWWLPIGTLTQILGFLFLLFVATTFFAVIRGSIDQIWGIRLKKDNSVIFLLGQR